MQEKHYSHREWVTLRGPEPRRLLPELVILLTRGSTSEPEVPEPRGTESCREWWRAARLHLTPAAEDVGRQQGKGPLAGVEL